MATKFLIKRNSIPYADREAAMTALDSVSFEPGLPVLIRYNGESAPAIEGIFALGTGTGTGSDNYTMFEAGVLGDYIETTPNVTAGYIPTWGSVDGNSLNGGYPVETTLVGSSGAIPRADAVKTYVDNFLEVANALVYKGVLDCSTNPNYPSASAGHLYIVSGSGKIGGASGSSVSTGNLLICMTDDTASGDHSTVGSNWNIVNTSVSGYQSLDSDLTAIAAITGTGLLQRTGTATWSVTETLDAGTF